MRGKPDIHPLAQTHLRELRERWHIEPDLAESLWIVQLCDRVLCPGGAANLDLIGVPERVGRSDTWLWPFTIGAGVWFERCAMPWYESSPGGMIRAEAFALAHARDRSVLTAIRDRQTSDRMIADWEAALDCTQAELADAIDRLYPPTQANTQADAQKPAVRRSPPDWDGLVAELEVLTGLPADHWLWEHSIDATITRLWQARRYAQARMGADPPHNDPLTDALSDLAQAKAAIIAAHKEPNEQDS